MYLFICKLLVVSLYYERFPFFTSQYLSIIPFSIILSVFLLFQTSISDINFFYLTCDLPPPPLYLDEFKENIIPQVSLATLLSKFNGVTEKEYKTHRDSTLRRFELRRLPPYLILYMKRFVKNIFTLEKNPTIVNFPIRSIDFGELLAPEFRAKHR